MKTWNSILNTFLAAQKIFKTIFIMLFIYLIPLEAGENNYKIFSSDGRIFTNVNLNALRNDSLYFRAYTQSMYIHSIAQIESPRPHKTGADAFYGFLGGSTIGAYFGYISYQKPSESNIIRFDTGPGLQMMGFGLIGGVAGAAIGAAIGNADKKSGIYMLGDKSLSEKGEIIEKLIRK